MGFLGPEGRRQLRVAGRFAGVGFELALAIVIGYVGGQWLDGKLGTGFIAYLGLALGIFAGFRSLYQVARSAQKDASKSDSERHDEPRP